MAVRHTAASIENLTILLDTSSATSILCNGLHMPIRDLASTRQTPVLARFQRHCSPLFASQVWLNDKGCCTAGYVQDMCLHVLVR